MDECPICHSKIPNMESTEHYLEHSTIKLWLYLWTVSRYKAIMVALLFVFMTAFLMTFFYYMFFEV